MFDRSPKSKASASARGPAPLRPGPQPAPGASADVSPSVPFDLRSLPIHSSAGRPVERPNRIGLPHRLKTGTEARSGVTRDDARERYRSPVPTRWGALAVSRGWDGHLGPGQERDMAHEARPEARGPVRPTRGDGAGAVIVDPRSETNPGERGHVALAVSQAFAPRPVRGAAFDQLSTTVQMESPWWRKYAAAVAGAAGGGLVGASLGPVGAIIGSMTGSVGAYNYQAYKDHKSDLAEVNDLIATRVKAANDQGISDDRLRSGESINNWHGKKKDLIGAQHKLPKRTLSYLWGNMTEPQQQKLNNRLRLGDHNESKAKKSDNKKIEGPGVGALARLPSNLINIPDGIENSNFPEHRLDDPDHTGEGVDFVRDESGSLTPRSREYEGLAKHAVEIHRRLSSLTEEHDDGAATSREASSSSHGDNSITANTHSNALSDPKKLTDIEAQGVEDHLYNAEKAHYNITKSTGMASYDKSFWKKQRSSFWGEEKYYKGFASNPGYANAADDGAAFEKELDANKQRRINDLGKNIEATKARKRQEKENKANAKAAPVELDEKKMSEVASEREAAEKRKKAAENKKIEAYNIWAKNPENQKKIEEQARKRAEPKMANNKK